MNRRTVETALVSAACLLSPAAHAQSRLPVAHAAEPTSDPALTTDLQTGSKWATSDEVDRPPAGSAAMRLRLVLPGDYGTWAYSPAADGVAIPVVGGEIALSSRWSLLLEGATDPIGHRFSGMASGLRLHLMPLASSLQLDLSGGFSEDLGGASGAWSELHLSDDVGRWHFMGDLRAAALSGGLATQPALSGSTGAAVDLLPARLGIEYAFQRGRETRSAVLPWVGVPAGNGHVTFRAGPVLPLNGASAFPARVSVAGNF